MNGLVAAVVSILGAISISMEDPVTEYAESVLAGEVVAGKLLKLACQRHMDDLAAGKFVWDLEAVDRVLKFARLVHHFKGRLRGQAFEPDPFQCFIMGSIVGWKDPATKLRRFKYAYVEVARKNAKTHLAAVLMLYFLAFDGEGAPEVYSAATKKEQAAIVWKMAVKFLKHSPQLRGQFYRKHSKLERLENDGEFEPLPADSTKLDGLFPHAVCYDELHAAPDRFLFDQLADGAIGREQPIVLQITTAGYKRTCFCYEQRAHGVAILEQDGFEDDLTFVFIASLDDEDLEDPEAWKREELWAKANPGLGTVKPLKNMRDEVKQAIQQPGKVNTVKVKQLNIWTAGQKRWLDLERFMKCGRVKFQNYDEAFESMAGRDCFTGLDLSSQTDFSGMVHVFPPREDHEREPWQVLCRCWIPEEGDKGLRERVTTDRIPADVWRDQGFVVATEGDWIDHNYIQAAIMADGERFNILEVGFDPHNASQLMVNLTIEGFTCVSMPQTVKTLNAPCKKLEVLTLAEQLETFGNPVLNWMASNAVVITNSDGNVRPDKVKSSERIDLVVALLMALGRAMVAIDEKSVYETRGPLEV